MARKVFFSFHYSRDAWRVSQVRNSNVVKSGPQKSDYLDHAAWQTIERSGDVAIKRWIDSQLAGSTLTCVLIGRQTSERKWVKYEIEQSILRKNAILGINIHNLKDQNSQVDLPGFSPLAGHSVGYHGLDYIAPVYDWELHDGYKNFGLWIDQAVDSFRRINWFRGE